MFLAGCETVRTEYVAVTPDIPATLLDQVVLPDRDVSGLQSVGVILADAIEGLELANGRILAINCILDAVSGNDAVKQCAAEISAANAGFDVP